MREYRQQKKKTYIDYPILAVEQRKKKAKEMRKYRLKKQINEYINDIYLAAESIGSPKKELESKDFIV